VAQLDIEVFGLDLTRPALRDSGGAHHRAGPPGFAFGDRYAAAGADDCPNGRGGAAYTDGIALI